MSNLDNKGKIFLIPSFLSEDNGPEILAPIIIDTIKNTNYYFVEEIRTARRFISKLNTGRAIEDLKFYILDKSTTEGELAKYFQEIPIEEDIGIISEAGAPGVADPGAIAVAFAHKTRRKVVPLPGPSSILLAIMGSGFSGQNFTFHGYLPIDKTERVKRVRQLEREAYTGVTQIFMETPYRNNQMLQDLVKELASKTLLCIASMLTSGDELIQTKSIQEWKNSMPDLHKKPTIFLMSASGK